MGRGPAKTARKTGRRGPYNKLTAHQSRVCSDPSINIAEVRKRFPHLSVDTIKGIRKRAKKNPLTPAEKRQIVKRATLEAVRKLVDSKPRHWKFPGRKRVVHYPEALGYMTDHWAALTQRSLLVGAIPCERRWRDLCQGAGWGGGRRRRKLIMLPNGGITVEQEIAMRAHANFNGY